MTTNIVTALVLGLALVIAAFLNGGGRYQIVTNSRGLVFTLDRWTGRVTFCTPNGCQLIIEKPEGFIPVPKQEQTP